MSDDNESPLGRWSRRKAEVRAGDKSEEPAPPAAPDAAAPETETEDAATEADIVAQLPDIDEMDGDSDFSVFMQDGVPENLQRLALRKLWLSDPVLANVDGLVDYGENFSIAETLGGAVKTIYQVGKGMIDETADEAAPMHDADQIEADDEAKIAGHSADGESPQVTQERQDDGEPPDQV
jgi:hypothetical protein